MRKQELPESHKRTLRIMYRNCYDHRGDLVLDKVRKLRVGIHYFLSEDYRMDDWLHLLTRMQRAGNPSLLEETDGEDPER